jgi:hypothetical protein
MTVALRKPITLAEFLAWEERQPARYEFDGFEPVAMTGGTVMRNRNMRLCDGCWNANWTAGPASQSGRT